MMILNLKKPFGLHGLFKNISALWGLIQFFNRLIFLFSINVHILNDEQCTKLNSTMFKAFQLKNRTTIPKTNF